MSNFRAELLVIRKRVSTWVLLGAMLLMTAVFGYVLPYSTYLSGGGVQGPPPDLQALLPQALVPNLIEGFPFYLGMVSLVLGAMVAGSEYGWGTIKTALIQTPNRLGIIAAKLGALYSILGVYIVLIFVVGALGSAGIAIREGAAIDWPAPDMVLRGLGAGWLILALWASFGVLLATLSRGTALAIGLGILYGLVIEGLLGRFLTSIDGLGGISEAFMRTNGYSLVSPLGAGGDPGAFAGPFVNVWQALGVILVYIIAFSGVSAFLFHRRDVT